MDILMYSALLPVGQGHLPAMNDSQRKNQGGPAGPETKPERGKPKEYICDRMHSTQLRLPKICLTQPLRQRWNLQLK